MQINRILNELTEEAAQLAGPDPNDFASGYLAALQEVQAAIEEAKHLENRMGPQEPPEDPRIFNRRQADGSFRPLEEFWDRDLAASHACKS